MFFFSFEAVNKIPALEYNKRWKESKAKATSVVLWFKLLKRYFHSRLCYFSIFRLSLPFKWYKPISFLVFQFRQEKELSVIRLQFLINDYVNNYYEIWHSIFHYFQPIPIPILLLLNVSFSCCRSVQVFDTGPTDPMDFIKIASLHYQLSYKRSAEPT